MLHSRVGRNQLGCLVERQDASSLQRTWALKEEGGSAGVVGGRKKTERKNREEEE